MVVVGPFFRPPKLAPVPKDILARFGLKSAKLHYRGLANFNEDEKVTPSSGTTLEAVLTSHDIFVVETNEEKQTTSLLQKPLHLLPLSCFKEVGELDFLIIESRENVYDDFQLVLGFEHRKRASEFTKQLEDLVANTGRRLDTKIYLASDNKQAFLLDQTTRSHQLLLTSISDCLTSLAYGDGAQILAPIAASRWNLDCRAQSASGPGDTGYLSE
ncbi:hypothetical protein C8J56DRAFT_371845 [Mycena floridula]|nr:hypothetical protein C8J56DRAFT_371845 [Mycena floridula]